MTEIITNSVVEFTVQSCQNLKNNNNKWRLYIPKIVSVNLRLYRGIRINIVLENNEIIETKTSCGKPIEPVNNKYYKPGYDLYHIEIHNFIKNHHIIHPKEKREKVKFKYLGKVTSIHTFEYFS